MLARFSKYKKQLILTTLVAAVFLYFWVNGPLNQVIEIGESGNTNSEFAIPKIVGQSKSANNFGIITTNKEANVDYGNGLLLQKKEPGSGSRVLVLHASTKSGAQSAEFISRAVARLKVEEHEIRFSGKYALANNRIYMESSPGFDHIKGYAGPINLGMITNMDNQIEGIWINASNETASYLRMLHRKSYFDQFNNLSFGNGQVRVDGVSGATITATTVAKISELMVHELSVEQTSYASMGNSVFEILVDNSLLWVLHLSIILLIFFYGYQSRVKKSKRNMLLLALFSVIYIGFFLNNSFTYISFMEPFLGTSISTFTGIYAFAAILGSIWGRNIYCKYVCPFGHAQRLVLQIPLGLKRKLPISNLWLSRIRNVITLVLIIGILLGLRHWKNFEVFPILFGYELLSISFVIALGLVLVSMIYPMFWCRVACPTGCVLDHIEHLGKSGFPKIRSKTKNHSLSR